MEILRDVFPIGETFGKVAVRINVARIARRLDWMANSAMNPQSSFTTSLFHTHHRWRRPRRWQGFFISYIRGFGSFASGS